MELTRRATIAGGLVASSALLAMSANALHERISEGSAVAAAIAAHRAKRAEVEAVYDLIDAAEQQVREEFGAKICRVQVGRMLGVGGAPDQPIYAYSIEEVGEHRDRWCKDVQILPFGERRAEVMRAKFEAMAADLSGQLDRWKSLEEQHGLPALRERSRQLVAEEDGLAADLVLTLASNTAEAEAKSAYYDEADFSDLGDEFFMAILARSVGRTGGL